MKAMNLAKRFMFTLMIFVELELSRGKFVCIGTGNKKCNKASLHLHEALMRLLLHDLPERQVDPLTDDLSGLRNFMLPKLLHCPSHDDERPIADPKVHRLFRLVVLDPKRPGRSQRQRADDVAHLPFVIGVHPNAVLTVSVEVQKAVVVLSLDGFDLRFYVQQSRCPGEGPCSQCLNIGT